MKRSKVEIKKRIAHRMNDRDLKRIYGDPNARPKTKPIHVGLVSRHELRTGRHAYSEILEFEPILSEKVPISIIITAYGTQDYIKECLDSIENQTYFINNDDFEVLIGVDDCKETLEKLLEIKHNYRNLLIFMMDSNKGTYVTSNTLLAQVKYDYILRFDSDDIMKPEMVNEIMYFKNTYDVVQFLFSDFTTSIEKSYSEFMQVAAGAHFYNKSVIELAGGYRAWKCAADSEFIKRIEKHVRIKEISKRLFYRRWHLRSITNKEETNSRSVVRKNYIKKIKVYGLNNKIKIKPQINTYIKIEKND